MCLALGQSSLALWVMFALVHAWLGALNLVGPGQPFGDVEIVYPFWVGVGVDNSQWVGHRHIVGLSVRRAGAH